MQQQQRQQQQAQQTQQAVQEVAGALNEFGLGMQNSSRQMQQNMMNTPMVAPNFQPFAPLGGGSGNRITCTTISHITTCR
jgi:hypothetical protein